MYLTTEVLEDLNAHEEDIHFIKQFFPNGAEVVDIMRAEHVDKDFLHWGMENLSLNEQEIEAYNQACKIVNSQGNWYSVNVTDSICVCYSENITASSGVFDSANIAKSRDIVECKNVEDASQIFFSNFVEQCEKIWNSNNVTNSINICNSSAIVNCKNIIYSSGAFGSSEIVRGKNVENSHFCMDCLNIKNCLFCIGIQDAEYCIFNQPVDENYYQLFEKQYKKFFTSLLAFVDQWPERLITVRLCKLRKNFGLWFSEIPTEFFLWAKSLPNYDELMLYNLTMRPDILI